MYIYIYVHTCVHIAEHRLYTPNPMVYHHSPSEIGAFIVKSLPGQGLCELWQVARGREVELFHGSRRSEVLFQQR